MKGNRSLLLIPLVIGGYILSSCGGSSRGLSADVSTFNTVVVYVTSASPNPLESDVVEKKTVNVNVNSRNDNVVLVDNNNNGICDQGDICCKDVTPNYPNYQTACCINVTQKDLCIGGLTQSDTVTFTFKSDVIRNAAGNPVTPNPSPVQVRYYNLSFGGMCIQGNYNYAVGAVIPPNQEVQVSIQPITVDMKSGLIGTTTYQYVNPDDGCITTFSNVPAYLGGICSMSAVIEFHLLELNSGLTRRYTFILPVRLADFQREGECSR